MKKTNLKLNEKCVQCGSCLGCGYNFLSTAEDGSIIVKTGTELSENSPEFRMLNEICPVEAFEIVETKSLSKQDYITALEKIKNYIVKCPRKDIFKFDKSEYSIPIPVASGERRYEYSSDSAAERAAEREFENKMYSQIDTLILKVITEYRVKYLKPYYTKLLEEGSIFAKCNAELEKLLEDMVSVLKCAGLADDLPEDFTNVDVFPENDIIWKMLNKGEVMSDEMISSVRHEFDSKSYSGLSSYNFWSIDSMEVYDSIDRKGNTKTKEKYCYKDIHNAFKHLAEDILSACYYADSNIEERAVELASGLIDVYNDLLQKAMEKRIVYLERKLELLPEEKDAVHHIDEYENIVRTIRYDPDKGFRINGEYVEKSEAYITGTSSEQFFYDGSVIKRRFISGGVIHNEVILKEQNFNYNIIIGEKGYIMFSTSDFILWVYDGNTNKLRELERNACNLEVYKETLFYLYWSNMNDRFSPCRICCCNLDGSGKRTLANSWNGIITIEKITDTDMTYKMMFSPYSSGTVKWN